MVSESQVFRWPSEQSSRWLLTACFLQGLLLIIETGVSLWEEDSVPSNSGSFFENSESTDSNLIYDQESLSLKGWSKGSRRVRITN